MASVPALVLGIGFFKKARMTQPLPAAQCFRCAWGAGRFAREGGHNITKEGPRACARAPPIPDGYFWLLTVSALRPLARRRLRTLRPFAVAMRARKPCLRARLILDGRYVGCMMKIPFLFGGVFILLSGVCQCFVPGFVPGLRWFFRAVGWGRENA